MNEKTKKAILEYLVDDKAIITEAFEGFPLEEFIDRDLSNIDIDISELYKHIDIQTSLKVKFVIKNKPITLD